jgi:CDP-diacylglycerol--glycerol-3-phosphate 3-phosphatidyltransferase
VFAVNLPNVLTLLRILLVPVLVVALLDETPNGDLLAAVVFAGASLTDVLDGHLARARGTITTFGKLMDPVADKLLIIAALVALVSLDRLAAWVAMVIIAREFAVTVVRMQVTQQGIVLAAGAWGKVKTVVQVGAIFCLIAFAPTPLWVDGLVYAMVAVTLASGADFFFGLRRQMARARAGPASPPHA